MSEPDVAYIVRAHSDAALDAWFPKVGPCGVCGTPGLDQRHRVIDAIAGRMAAGESMEDVAADYGEPIGAIQAVLEWAVRWPEAWQ